ncbi:MAG: Na(+)/H(+) antiporter subunit F [Bacteroidales bacterium]|nr:Na(+)/H(+) antiporter subunit F [Bacteroidales bacterium]
MVNTILTIAGALMLVAILLSLYRFLKGPTTADKVVAFDVMTVSSSAILVLLGYYSNRYIYLDVALVYGLLSFIGVIIVARYIEKGY